MFVLLMMPHVGPMIRQYNIFYSILFYSIENYIQVITHIKMIILIIYICIDIYSQID